MSRDLRQEAIEIWSAGVAAVQSERLVAGQVLREGDRLTVCGHSFDLRTLGQIVVVGAGKAGAGMAAGLEQALGPDLVASQLSGWVNVPADCVRPLQKIHLHAARPAGRNEPTDAGVTGTQEILRRVSTAGPNDLCLCLLSGGGSALLPAPKSPLTLADKQAVTRFLMSAGVTISELNLVRTALSEVKGGGLARACRAGTLITLIISDVIGDPLSVIASGPTLEMQPDPAAALALLQKLGARPPAVPQAVFSLLQSSIAAGSPTADSSGDRGQPTVFNQIIGNNDVARQAAAEAARQRGYQVQSLGSANQGDATATGRELARLGEQIRAARQESADSERAPVCVLSGGEPTVKLAVTEEPRSGGRNQQLVLAALDELWDRGVEGLALLSGGTDGEDGPTDAAGAVLDQTVWQTAHKLQMPPAHDLAINNAYGYWDRCGGLLRTGPTHTNVMDLRVLLIAPPADHERP